MHDGFCSPNRIVNRTSRESISERNCDSGTHYFQYTWIVLPPSTKKLSLSALFDSCGSIDPALSVRTSTTLRGRCLANAKGENSTIDEMLGIPTVEPRTTKRVLKPPFKSINTSPVRFL